MKGIGEERAEEHRARGIRIAGRGNAPGGVEPIDIGAEFAEGGDRVIGGVGGVLRVFVELGDGGAEHPAALDHEGVARGGPGGQLGFGVRRLLGEGELLPLAAGADDLVDEVGLGSEESEEGNFIDASDFGDSPRGGAPESRLGVDLGGGIEDLLSGRL